MRAAWAILLGLGLGIGLAWWLSREDGKPPAGQRPGAARAGTGQPADALPGLYRWRDAGGNLQITEQPPQDRPYERIERQPARGIAVDGDKPD